MVRKNKLTQMAYNAKPDGKYADGSGLYVEVRKDLPMRYSLRYTIKGKSREMGLGTAKDIPLAKVREQALELKAKLKSGIDPLEAKARMVEVEGERKLLAQKQQQQDKATFEKVALEYMSQKEAEWKNPKHRQQWRNTLKTYVFPFIGGTPVNSINRQDVVAVIHPHWLTKNETMTRVRQRIEAVMDYAIAMDYREGRNPAEWKSSIKPLLPSPAKVQKKTKHHHAALDYELLPDFMIELQAMEGLAALALQLTILTAARTSEVLKATWEEIDLDNRRWLVPAGRMKADKEHRVVLSSYAIALLKQVPKTSDLVFQGMKKGKPLCGMSMLKVLQRMERTDITVHGFRSTFRDWIAEQTHFPARVAETALAHQLKDNAERAYQRRDLIDKRIQLMEAWAQYCYSNQSNVIQLHA